jgi:NTP-dependent ternary system trypsin peptidase co-occuring protein
MDKPSLSAAHGVVAKASIRGRWLRGLDCYRLAQPRQCGAPARMSEPTTYPLANLVEALSTELREAHRRASNRSDGPAFDLESATAELAIGWETNKDGGIDFQVFKLGGSLTRNNTSTLSVTVRPTSARPADVVQQTLGAANIPGGYAVGLIASDRVGRLFDVPDIFGTGPQPKGLYQPILDALSREPAGLSEQRLFAVLERLFGDMLTQADWRPTRAGVPAWHGRARRALRVLRDLALVVLAEREKVWRVSNVGVGYLKSTRWTVGPP